MAANVDAMVREGIHALQEGNKEEARALLMKAVEIDQLNEQGWLWLSAVVDSMEDQATCLENVLMINPNNERARQGMQYIEQQRKGGGPPTPTAAASAPSAPPRQKPEAAATPVASEPTDKAAAEAKPKSRAGDMPTSVEWAAPEAEASASTPAKRPFELSDDEYDSWVNTLNLPTTTKSPEESSEDEDDEVVDVEQLQAMFGKTPAAKPEAAARAPKKENKPKARPPAAKAKPQPEPEYEPLFPTIPEEIKTTRLPGTRERLPILVWFLLVVLLSLNAVAAILLFQRLFPN